MSSWITSKPGVFASSVDLKSGREQTHRSSSSNSDWQSKTAQKVVNTRKIKFHFLNNLTSPEFPMMINLQKEMITIQPLKVHIKRIQRKQRVGIQGRIKLQSDNSKESDMVNGEKDRRGI